MRVVLLVSVAVLAAAASAGAANDVRATMSTSSTMPLAGSPWRYTIVVQDKAGKPVVAKVRLQILLGTLVVGCWKKTALAGCAGANAGTWISFRGKRTASLTWPARFAGGKLTFQATIIAGARSLKLRTPLTVRLP